MRKRTRRTIRREAAPTLVAYYLNPEVSTQERMAVLAIEQGIATEVHFDVLADCLDMLGLASAEKKDAQTTTACELALIAMHNIKDRYVERQRIGANGDELQALHLLVDVSEDFWKRQSGSMFIDAEAALSELRASQRAAREDGERKSA